MSTPVRAAAEKAIEQQVSELVQAFTRGKNEFILMAIAAQIATIGTKQSDEALFALLERFRKHDDKVTLLTIAMIICSPYRAAYKKRLRAMLKNDPEALEAVTVAYEMVRTAGTTFRSLRSLPEEIIKAIEWKTDDSGD